VVRIAAAIGLLGLFGLLFASLDLQPSLKRVNVAILSGAEGGNYHKLVEQLATAAGRDRGRIRNITTQGSVDNIERLAAAGRTCDAQFAVVQDGLDWPPGIELLARLPRAESVFFLGREADRMHGLKDFQGLRVGVGPTGSGTNRFARTILQSEDLVSLRLTLTNHPLDEQLSLLQSGDLDLGVLVMDEDAPMVMDAVRNRGLAILSLPQADVIARRLRRVHTGRIGAGQYDPVRLLPPTDKTVLRVETLVVGNGCASRSASTGLLTLLSRELPGLVGRNQQAANATGLPLSAVARSFFENGGPDLASQYVPWALDIMPLSNWIYAITATSLLMNLMTMLSKFHLWRLDAQRVDIEERLAALLRSNITPGEIERLAPTSAACTPGHRAEIAEIIGALEALHDRCRRHSLGWLPDMGEEMPYRYQEQLMEGLLRALRRFRDRVEEDVGTAQPPAGPGVIPPGPTMS
jgi:TRAP-type uncharacterized transport system substrate-binding protein